MKPILLLATMAAFLCALLSVPAQTTSATALTHLDLGGQWQVSAADSNDWFAATVPGCIHTDLLAAGRIPDPFYRDNESKVQWVSELPWTYRRTFSVSPDLLAHQHLLLRCEGLDTLAEVLLNGTSLGHADNMFRCWEFDAKPLLHAGTNSLEIRFASVLPVIRADEAARPLPTWAYPGAAYVRKMPCDFGWDWGPTLITCGIWRPISLVAFDTARLDDVQILQDHSHSGSVALTLNAGANPPTSAALTARWTVTSPGHHQSFTAQAPLTNGAATASLTIEHPQLWWPNGMGKHPLYTVSVDLLDEQGHVLDSAKKRIGLRTLRVFAATNSTPMHFVVNGIPFFAKGASWIPADAFPTRVTTAKLRQSVADAASANMNSLRFWGGGYYEDDALFDACDEMGICVWLDFKFACSTYPAFDPAFIDNVRQEAVEQVKRLRHHPSIAVWCGNNEIMYFRGGDQWTTNKMSAPDYYHMFRDTIGAVMQELNPQGDYVTGSPDCGDVHFWDVWHGGKPFEAYRTMHGFVSEFGFESYDVPETVDSFTAPEDRTSVYSPMVRYHMRSGRMWMTAHEDGTVGTDKMMKLVRENFHETKDFDSTIWVSQINQAFGIEFAAEGWRREMPVSTGCLYWQYNDNWPGTSWSSVDYFGRWKALMYRSRHFYAPLLLSADFDSTNGQARLWLTSDKLSPVAGNLTWRVTDLAGTELRTGTQPAGVAARQSSPVADLPLADLIQQHGATNLLVWLSFEGGRGVSASNLLLLAKPRYLELRDPGLTADIAGAGTNYTVSVQAKNPALWVWLDLPGVGARMSENFVPLAPGATAQFTVTLAQPLAKDEFTQALKVRSLYDTYNHSAQ